jgi:hypothetical protein
MAKFVTIGYGDEAGYNRTPPQLRDAGHAHDAALTAKGAVSGVAGHPVQVRNTEHRGIETTSGPYLRSELPIAGFGLIDAANLEEAIALVAELPCAVNHGVIEVWPLDQGPSN